MQVYDECVHVREGAHRHARVRICLIYLKIEGEELGKDQRDPFCISPTGKLLVSFL